jgi:hypothetical protein
MNLTDKIVFTFNKFYSSFIKDIKEISEDLRPILKKNYKAINKLSAEHIDLFLGEHSFVFKDITLEQLQDATKDQQETVENYLNILRALVYVYKNKEDTENEDQNEILFNHTLEVIKKVQASESPQDALDSILDDDLKEILIKLTPTKMPSQSHESTSGVEDLLGGLGNSKIAKLAQEISKDIDVSGIDIQKPEDVVKLMDFSNGNVLGDIISKVSTKIHDKIATGELKQEDLLGEAMSMMNLMGGAGSFMNNPMVSELMKNMKKGKTQMRQDAFKKADVRQRLRNKLEQKQNKNL